MYFTFEGYCVFKRWFPTKQKCWRLEKSERASINKISKSGKETLRERYRYDSTFKLKAVDVAFKEEKQAASCSVGRTESMVRCW